MQKCYRAKEGKKKSMCFQRETAADCTTSSALHEAWSTNLRTPAFWFDFLKMPYLTQPVVRSSAQLTVRVAVVKLGQGSLCVEERGWSRVWYWNRMCFLFLFFFLFLGKPAMWLDIPEVFESHQGHQDHEKCQDQPKILPRVRTALRHQDQKRGRGMGWEGVGAGVGSVGGVKAQQLKSQCRNLGLHS